MTGGHLAFTSISYRARTDGRTPMRTRILLLLALAVVAAAAAGTATGRTPKMPPASSFTARVDNPWFPLLPGTRYLYTGVKDGKSSRDVVTVTRQTRRIEGVPCVAVRDRLYLRGHLAEWTPLEPGVIDHKMYVRGIGTVLEQTQKGGNERNELIAVTRS